MNCLRKQLDFCLCDCCEYFNDDMECEKQPFQDDEGNELFKCPCEECPVERCIYFKSLAFDL